MKFYEKKILENCTKYNYKKRNKIIVKKFQKLKIIGMSICNMQKKWEWVNKYIKTWTTYIIG